MWNCRRSRATLAWSHSTLRAGILRRYLSAPPPPCLMTLSGICTEMFFIGPKCEYCSAITPSKKTGMLPCMSASKG